MTIVAARFDHRRFAAGSRGDEPRRIVCANYRKLFSIAHRVAADNSMLVNYNQLTVPVISSVLRFFKVSLSADEVSAIDRKTRVYSKEASGTRTFVADSDEKHQLASDRIREMAERWATEPYRQLEEKRLAQESEIT